MKQSGQILVLFALGLLAITAMVGLVVDGGDIYVQRRTAQNAADAAALAGARALLMATTNPTSAIGTEICKYLLANSFGTPPTGSAYFVDINGGPLGAITLPTHCVGSANSGIPTGAAGVHVDATIGPFNTYLVQIVDIRNMTVRADASAGVGVLGIPNAYLTPLAGCGPDMLFDGKSDTPFDNILLGDGVTTAYSINPARYGDDLVLQGAQLSSHEDPAVCPSSGGVSWKGKLNISGLAGVLVPPMSVPTDNGNGTIDTAINNACAATGQGTPVSTAPLPDVCLLLVPIAAPPNPTGDANIVTFACMSLYTPVQGFQKWRGVLRPTGACNYGTYTRSWTWGTLSANTKVFLAQ
ncbi:MAG TPA: pilus assembly protein TadG-related protein [Chloroflexota bacterium]|nr:pilus assembly protein TadG-related protein [Chloroflexota bacterium]